ANGFNILTNEWREKLERHAQGKFRSLRLENNEWKPYAVIRDTQFAFPGESKTMRPIAFGFRLAKKI
ncbi:MAG: hypothetical protein ACREJU_19620, partial [Nitrospiraceae bacterium]